MLRSLGPRLERCLGEIERVLTPGGRVGLYITDRDSLDARALTQSELFINRFDGQELADVLATAGFEETEAHTREIRSGRRLRTGHVVLGFSKRRLDLNN